MHFSSGSSLAGGSESRYYQVQYGVYLTKVARLSLAKFFVFYSDVDHTCRIIYEPGSGRSNKL